MSQEDQKQPRVPELELSVAVQLFKDRYSIFNEPVEGKPYSVRFKKLQRAGEPKLAVQGMTHGKGTMIHPLFILKILKKFDIPVEDFLEGLAFLKKGPQAVEKKAVNQ